MYHIGISVSVPATPERARTAVGAGAEDPHPAVEQQVVERRRAVVAQRAGMSRSSGSRAMLTDSTSSAHRSDWHTNRRTTPSARTPRTPRTTRRRIEAAAEALGARLRPGFCWSRAVAAPRGDSHAHQERLPPRGSATPTLRGGTAAGRRRRPRVTPARWPGPVERGGLGRRREVAPGRRRTSGAAAASASASPGREQQRPDAGAMSSGMPPGSRADHGDAARPRLVDHERRRVLPLRRHDEASISSYSASLPAASTQPR